MRRASGRAVQTLNINLQMKIGTDSRVENSLTEDFSIQINTMRNFLLIFLSLMITGWEASSEVKGCTDGWVEFICQHNPTHQYQSVDVVKNNHTIIGSTQKNVWQTKNIFSVYYDAANRKLRVVIKPLQHGDSGEYKCKFIFEGKSESDKVDLNVGKGCQTPFNQTAYRTAKTTISCDKRNSTVMFFCKENGSICEDILSTKSFLRSNGSFTLTETSSSFNMSISNVSSQHAGVYWCGVETDKGSNRAALRKIQLEVEDTITSFTRYPTVGQNLTYWCGYPKSARKKSKFICKGEDPSICRQIVSTTQSNAGKFSMMDDNVKKITITVRNITTEDTGTYWCGAESNDPKQSNPFFHRFRMTVGESSYFILWRLSDPGSDCEGRRVLQ
ncbi:polymeric immunoglobulin receptor-like [Perca fluviatilis]|uniref:polymeric immunoglobulin receptor-like n=1 Tax=Perca fluviatilis TaxID=8168 RepID=UPI0019630943|nr:polymeric immunoglobulin receptor-like [Perca fluviatilis]